MRNQTGATKEIKKLQLEEMVLFAINHIPQADATTLKLFLELANAGGSFGAISAEQILRKMHQVLKYVPGTCAQSCLILLDLLEIKPPQRLPVNSGPAQAKPEHRESRPGASAFFLGASSAARAEVGG